MRISTGNISPLRCVNKNANSPKRDSPRPQTSIFHVCLLQWYKSKWDWAKVVLLEISFDGF